jgi:hypothetical protein
VRVGQLRVRDGAESGLAGLDLGLALRMGGGR